jgi:hypothetical protein
MPLPNKIPGLILSQVTSVHDIVSRAHDLVTRAYDIASRAHDLVTRVHDKVFRAHNIIISCARLSYLWLRHCILCSQLNYLVHTT